MIYAHSVLYVTQFNIQAQFGATRSTARLTSIGIGDTVQDGPGDCWTGWHVHEVNNDGGDWDSWNSNYNGASTPCNCYVNTNDANWIRRMTATVLVGE
jgi:hypothetical protein